MTHFLLWVRTLLHKVTSKHKTHLIFEKVTQQKERLEPKTSILTKVTLDQVR